MIEKLPFTKIHSGGEDMVDRVEFRPVSSYEMQQKINELVDAVNKLQESRTVSGRIRIDGLDDPFPENVPEYKGYIKLDNDSLQKFLKAHPEYNNNGVIEIPKKELTDPFAEQRGWIGKLCKFWNDDPNDYIFDKLKEITLAGCYIKESGFVYEHCEPVKPDDDIIYKGE